jgi:CO/xanthine dehydrogenase FAD-binding subunit
MVKGYYPKSLHEALKLLTMKETHMLICGGSDIMVTKKTAPNMIFINQIENLKDIKEDNEMISIGACCVYRQILTTPSVPKILHDAINQIASPAIRNVGTMGGNICNASPAGDTLPILYAMDATIVKASINEDGTLKKTRLPIADFILGIRKIDLAQNEMVIAIEIEKKAYENMTVSYFKKVGGREASAISKLSFVGLKKIENNSIQDVRIAFGSVGITTLRSKKGEKLLLGLGLDELDTKKDEILEFYKNLINPIDDQRSTATYRKKVCLNLLEDFLVS